MALARASLSLYHDFTKSRQQSRPGFRTLVCVRLPAEFQPSAPKNLTGIRCQVPEDDPSSGQTKADNTRERTSTQEKENRSASNRASQFTTMTAIALLGSAETAYLTYEKLWGDNVVCPLVGGTSCDSVLSSSYATLLGLPLPLYGFVAYSSVALLSIIAKNASSSPLGISHERESNPVLKWLLLLLTASMASTSAYLMYLLFTQLDSQICVYCLSSAALSFSLLYFSSKSFSREEMIRAATAQVAIAAVAAISLSLAYGTNVRSAYALGSSSSIDLQPIAPEVSTTSTPLGVALAKHLTAAGAKMYGAFWCSHCYEQKTLFGAEATKYLDYIECYPEGYRKGIKIAKACEDANIEGFPSWVINGKVLKSIPLDIACLVWRQL